VSDCFLPVILLESNMRDISLTAWSRIIVKKLIVCHMVRFSALYGT
jgi:hypothetical protein